tara:strand:- start:5021 stop:5632 length:612 start_codon:yes stop_codon:yes gene_type:complete
MAFIEKKRMGKFNYKLIMNINIVKIFETLFKDLSQDESIELDQINDESFHQACKLLRTQREKCNLTRNALATKTKISIVVLEAIEKGWTNQFPEKAFLKKMLSTIEINLHLPKDSLISILNKSNDPKTIKKTRSFTPWNIDIYRTWHGNFIYIIIILISIFALNRTQNNLSDKNMIKIKLINSEVTTIEKKEIIETNNKSKEN